MEDKNKKEKEKEYLPFEPYYSKSDIYDESPSPHRLFDDTPEQISHGMASWDNLGWSRDGWSL